MAVEWPFKHSSSWEIIDDGRLFVARQLRSWGRKVTTGRPQSDGELISVCGLTKLETNAEGKIVWHDCEGELDTK